MRYAAKYLFLLLVTVLISAVAHAQKFSASVFAGISSSQVSGDRLGGFNKVGVMCGGSVMTRLSDHFDMEMEMMFVQKGSRKPIDGETGDYSYYKMRLNYIEVPLLFNWNYVQKFIFYAGPSVSQLLFSQEEDEYGIITGQKPFYKTELSINGGMYYALFKNGYIDIRISNSVIPIRDNPSGLSTTFNHGQYNTVLSFSLKYRFNKAGEGQ